MYDITIDSPSRTFIHWMIAALLPVVQVLGSFVVGHLYGALMAAETNDDDVITVFDCSRPGRKKQTVLYEYLYIIIIIWRNSNNVRIYE